MKNDTKQDLLPVIGITSGDAAGIGPEILLKALHHPDIPNKAKFIIYARKLVIDHAIGLFGTTLDYNVISSARDAVKGKGRIFLIDPTEDEVKYDFGAVSKITSADAMQFVKLATGDALDGGIDGFVTAPINKAGIQAAGYNETGHTGYIAGLCGIDDYAMMFVGGGLRVVLLTIHVPLRDVPGMVMREVVYRKLLLIDHSMKKWFGLKKPRVAVCGLNPHAGEGGILGNEDDDEIAPAVAEYLRKNKRVVGPLPADTIFGRARNGEFDVVLAMYHDQGLIPIKALAFGKGVNITIGLPFIRTSPDHGTAYDIAGRGCADPGSMIEAIKVAIQLAENGARA